MNKYTTCERKETAAKILFGICAAFSVFAVFSIVGYLLYASIPAFREIGFFNFLFGSIWAPTKDFLPPSERFGILPMIVSTIAATAGATLLGGTLGIFTAIFTVFFCPKKIKGALEQAINLFAGIPSIIYGFFGLIVIVPLLAMVSANGSGKGLLAVSIILGMMILPIVTGITKDSLKAVPASYYEGAVALGATKAQAVFKVVLPAARSGVVSSIVLGLGRAIGETMAVYMVAGNNPQFPTGLFDSMRTLTANIVLEMSYSEGLHRSALIATGFVLLLFVLIINIVLGYIKGKKKSSYGRHKLETNSNIPYTFRRRQGSARALKTISATSAILITSALLFLVGFVLVKGLPHLSFNFLFGESGNEGMTLAPAFASTGLLILVALVVALPIGIGSAIFLVEYAKKGSKVVKFIRLFVDTLAGIPSIVFGLFGMIVFCDLFGLKYSLLSGGLTLSIIIMPTIIRSVEESLMSVPDTLREGSLALGASKVRTIFKIVLPSAMRGILTAIILSVGRIVGESAALIYTSGAVAYMPESILDPGSSFAVMMWLFAGEGLYIDSAYATATVLLILVAVLNGLVMLCGRKKKNES